MPMICEPGKDCSHLTRAHRLVSRKTEPNFPATVKSRTDIDLTFTLDNYSTDLIKIDLAETVELSYNKRESVLSQDKAKLQEQISEGVLFEWFKGATKEDCNNWSRC